MGRVIDFHTAREIRPAPVAAARCRCTICGADLWHINSSGEVCCADCETACPYRLQSSPAAAGRRQAECSLGATITELHEDDIHA
jgi:hypothetical protein